MLIVGGLLAGACSSGDPDATAQEARAPGSGEVTTTQTAPGGDDADADRSVDDVATTSSPAESDANSNDADAGADSPSPPPSIDAPAPPTTTDPPRPTDGPDAPPPPDSGPTTTLVPVPPPEPAAVERVVSLAATHTETLFALGAGDLLVAVDVDSDFPEEAGALQGAGLTESLADPGAVRALDPDLVIVGADPTEFADRLTAAGVPVWRGPPPDDVDAALAQILELGELVGRAEAADELVSTMRAELDQLRSSVPEGATYFHEVDPSIFTIVPGTFLDRAYGALGLDSVMPPGGGGQDGGGEAFVRVDTGVVVDLDPDVLILADAACCDVTAARAGSRPGWSGVSAVEQGAIAELTDRLAERWGVSLRELWRLVGTAAANA